MSTESIVSEPESTESNRGQAYGRYNTELERIVRTIPLSPKMPNSHIFFKQKYKVLIFLARIVYLGVF